MYNHILEDLGRWDLFDLLLNMRQATVVSNRWVVLTYQNCISPKCYSFAQPSGQTPLLQTPSNHHEPPTVPTRNTNGGSCSRSVLVYKSNVYMFMLIVWVSWCAFLMFAPFLTARAQYQTQRWEEVANGTWRGETDQFEVEKEMRMSLSLHTIWISVFYCNGFPQCQVYPISIQSSFLLNIISNPKPFKSSIKCFNVFNLTALSPHEYQPLFSYKWTWTLDSAKLPTRS